MKQRQGQLRILHGKIPRRQHIRVLHGAGLKDWFKKTYTNVKKYVTNPSNKLANTLYSAAEGYVKQSPHYSAVKGAYDAVKSQDADAVIQNIEKEYKNIRGNGLKSKAQLRKMLIRK